MQVSSIHLSTETEESIREQESELQVEIEAQISSGKKVRLPSVTFDDFAKQVEEPKESAQPEMTVALVCVFVDY